MAALGSLAGCGLGAGLTLLWQQQRRREPAEPVPMSFQDDLTQKALGALTLNLVGLGDELGLFSVLAVGPATPQELAAKTSCDLRYLQEWCLHMAAARHLSCGADGRFELAPAVRAAAGEPSSFSLSYSVPAMIGMRNRLVQAYQNGEGIDWGDHDHRLFCGTRLFFQPIYENMLVPNVPLELRPLLDGGCALADVGCGEGISSIILAEAFPKVQLTGFDYHAPSVQKARALCRDKGLKNASFAEANANGFGEPASYDVVTFFDCFHDMAPAEAAAQRAYAVLRPGGFVWLIELLAAENDCVHEQVKLPTAPIMTAFSCHVCLPCGKMHGGAALGTVCPTATHRDIFTRAGFKDLSNVPSPLNAVGFRLLIARK